MKKFRNLLIAVICLSMVVTLFGCSNSSKSSSSSGSSASSEGDESNNANADTLSALSDDEIYTADFESLSDIKDGEYYESYKDDEYVTITLDNDNTSIDGEGASYDGGVLTITQKGFYYITGTLDDGQIVVDCDEDDKVKIIFDNVTVTNSTGACFVGLSAKKIIITSMAGSTNTFADGNTYSDTSEEISACIYSETDLIFNGTGKIIVNANYNNGIQTKDKLKILEGSFEITSADDAIVGRDEIIIKEGTFAINAGGDGLKSTNEEEGNIIINDGEFIMDVSSKGINSVGAVIVYGGEFDITCYDGYTNASAHSGNDFMRQMQTDDSGNISYENESDDEADETEDSKAKGIMAETYIVIHDGSFKLNVANDAIHSNNIVMIENTDITIDAGDDGIHAESELLIASGTISINNSYEGIEAPSITINGGDIGVNASDDGINAAGGSDSEGITGMEESSGYLYINGGNISVNSNGDGLDANTDIEVTGGNVYVNGPTDSGNGSLDYGRNFVMSGGTVIAVGSSGMLQTISDESTVCALNIVYSTSGNAGDEIKITDSDGNAVFEYETIKNYQAIVVASEDLVSGGNYSVYCNGDKLTDVTLNSTITSIDENGNETTISDGMMGGRGGNRQNDMQGDMSDGNMPSGMNENSSDNNGQMGGRGHGNFGNQDTSDNMSNQSTDQT